MIASQTVSCFISIKLAQDIRELRVCSRACGLGVASHLPNQSEFHHEMWMCNKNLILGKDADHRALRSRVQNILD